MAVREFKITLDSSRHVFYPGEQLTGNVVLDLHGPMSMKGITIEFEGESKCHWTEKRYEGEGENRREVTDHIEGKEKYFENKTCLFGVVSGGSARTHPYGHFKYPFVFNIPQSVPSTFEGHTGWIRYELKAEIDIPGQKDIKTKRAIIINEIVDTNNTNYRQGAGGQVTKEVGCLCWKAGPLEIQANIDRKCYCPGEYVLFDVQVHNQTTRDMTSVKAKLTQEVLYIAKDNKRKHETNIVAEISSGGILKGKSETWSHKPMAIPACTPSIGKSAIVKVSYAVTVEVGVPWGIDPVIHLPITIGTVPFIDTYGEQQQFGLPQEVMQIAENNFDDTPQMPPAPVDLLGHPGMIPPAYSAPIKSKRVNIHRDDNSKLMGDSYYVPVYTFAAPYKGPCPFEPGTQSHAHQQPGYPPQPPHQPPIGFVPGPPSQPGYPSQNPRYPPQNPGYPPQNPGYPPQQPGYPP